MKELDIQDCKVRVLNVDSQASFENIVVQVIGEMSNKSEPHHRFVQTFVLATQQNGYYVLNDIFRYLNDDEDEIFEDAPTQDDSLAQEEALPAVAPTIDAEPTEEAVTDKAGAEQVDAKLEEIAKAAEENTAPSVNGTGAESPAEPPTVDEAVPKTASEVLDEASEPDVTEPDVTEPAIDTTLAEKPAEPESTPAQTPAKPTDPAPVADLPPAKKTWANMVGAKAPTPVVPVLTTPVIPSQPKPQKSPQPTAPQSSTSETATTTTSPAPQGNGWQTAEHSKKQNRPQAKAATESNALAYIKNVNEKIQASDLRSELEKYGELKYFDVSRQRVSHSSSNSTGRY
jgi:hypothetical protein